MPRDVRPIAHYEVYTLERDRWTLQMRYRADEKDFAISEARHLEKTLGTKAKVIRETYDPTTNTSTEVTVYASQRPSSGAAPAAATSRNRQPPRPTAEPGRRIGPGRYQPPKPPSGTSGLLLAVKVAGIVLAGLVVAVVVSAVISLVIAQLSSWNLLASPKEFSGLLMVVFAVAFLITAVPLAMILINNAEDIEALTGWRRVEAAPRISRAGFRPDFPEPPPPAQGATPPPDEPPAPVEVPAPPVPAAEPPPAPAPTTAEAPQAAEPPAGGASPVPVALEAQRLKVLRFLDGTIAELKKDRPQLDRYNTFGVDLMLAGAVEMLGEREGVDPEAQFGLLRAAMEILGTKGPAIEAFCEQYEQYLREPRYLQMIQAGREAMDDFLANADNPHEALRQALDRWNRPTGKTAGSRIVTVIFTDIVGSTTMTQTLGDVGAQEAVRRHNSIVRTALSDFDGKEIKHTGDGIMASFSSATNAVDAALSIQRAVAAHNAASPDLPLHLRIGMSTGEPIEEEDDLFGTTVQTAARACAAAEADSILCTNVVRELSSGRGHSFVSKGDVELKGFKEPIGLYEVRQEQLPAA
ncbi:MAG: adenylate/guanylate cyclase domain-containing protein [Rhodospirillales bacterium]|nr:adenylate/guanylate cyclase domain-containing protein [Rhodospirillales bacterium]